MKKKYELLPLPGWEGLYAVRYDKVISLRSGEPLKPKLSGPKRRQYYEVHLYLPGCKSVSMKVHRAVMSAKLGRELPEGMQVDHIDNNPLNNSPENLRLLTCSDNIQAGYDLKRAAGKTSTEFRGIHKNGNVYFRAYAKIPGETKSVCIGQYYRSKYDALEARILAEEFGILTEQAKRELEKRRIERLNRTQK